MQLQCVQFTFLLSFVVPSQCLVLFYLAICWRVHIVIILCCFKQCFFAVVAHSACFGLSSHILHIQPLSGFCLLISEFIQPLCVAFFGSCTFVLI